MSSNNQSLKEPNSEITPQPVQLVTLQLINEYKNQLSVQEKLVLNIASCHLGSSFDITKSIGFIKWSKS